MTNAEQNPSPNGDADALAGSGQYITEPILHIQTGNVSEQELMAVFYECLKARPHIDRQEQPDSIKGTIEFEDITKAERAYATLKDTRFPSANCAMLLSINQDASLDPAPKAKARLAKHLPEGFTSGRVFDLFRKFGGIYRVSLQQAPHGGFSGLAVVEFYEEEDAESATQQLHFSEVEGVTIAVQVFEPAKGPIRGIGYWAEAPTFVPAFAQHQQRSASYGGNGLGIGRPYQLDTSQWAPRRNFTHAANSPSMMSAITDSPGDASQTEPAGVNAYNIPVSLPYDPTNLFCKSLHPLISSQDLFQTFKPFGRIISARVMRDERTGNSKEFGFVSFSRPEEAAAAQQALNGQPLWGLHGHSQSIIVRFHEPKKAREIRSKDRFTGPRERANSYDAEIEDDMTKRVTGFSPTSSPPVPGSPISQQGFSHAMLRHASISSSGSSSPPSVLSGAMGGGGMPMAFTQNTASEKDRLLNAVVRLIQDNARAEAIADLLASLPKRDRALCLFNGDILNTKIQEATEVLDAQGDETLVGQVTQQFQSTTINPGKEDKIGLKGEVTLHKIATLSAAEIIALASSDSPPPVLAAPNPDVVAQTDAFVDSLQEKDVSEQKQKLGEKLVSKQNLLSTSNLHSEQILKQFKIIKGLGFKNAPRLTIHLLDTEDLRALAHLMNEQIEVLKEKAGTNSSLIVRLN